MDELPPAIPSPNPQRPLVVILGMIGANAVMGIVYGGVWFLTTQLDSPDFIKFVGLPSLFLVPVLGGLVSALCWRTLEPTIGQTALFSVGAVFFSILGASVLFREGVICLLIVSPLFYGLIFCGALLGRIWFKADPTRLRLCILPLLVVTIAGEPFSRTDEEGCVTDEILIRAPASKVWPEVTSFPDIPAEPDFWLFRLGLPYPMSTTSAGDFVGAERLCIFNKGAVFRETVAEILPNQKLTFDIIESPPDPELIGHLTPLRGQFELRDNGNGTTTLIGRTWYALHVRPLWYFDWWTHHIFRAVHLRVMEDVRRRSEADL